MTSPVTSWAAAATRAEAPERGSRGAAVQPGGTLRRRGTRRRAGTARRRPRSIRSRGRRPGRSRGSRRRCPCARGPRARPGRRRAGRRGRASGPARAPTLGGWFGRPGEPLEGRPPRGLEPEPARARQRRPHAAQRRVGQARPRRRRTGVPGAPAGPCRSRRRSARRGARRPRRARRRGAPERRARVVHDRVVASRLRERVAQDGGHARGAAPEQAEAGTEADLRGCAEYGDRPGRWVEVVAPGWRPAASARVRMAASSLTRVEPAAAGVAAIATATAAAPSATRRASVWGIGTAPFSAGARSTTDRKWGMQAHRRVRGQDDADFAETPRFPGIMGNGLMWHIRWDERPAGCHSVAHVLERGYTAPRFVGPVLRAANWLDALTEPTSEDSIPPQSCAPCTTRDDR